MEGRRRPSVSSPILSGLLTILLSHGLLADEQFDKRPGTKPYYVRENQPGPVLECTVSEKYRGSRYDVEWMRYANNSPRTLSRNGKLVEKKNIELIHDASAGRYDLQIKNVTRSESGTYHCQIIDKNGEEQHHADAEVTVVVPPGDPSITMHPTDPVNEGDIIHLECESVGGSPSPTFKWQFDNGSFMPNELYTHEIDGTTAKSVINWRALPADNNRYVTCLVWNIALSTDSVGIHVNTPRLNVLYAPRVHVGPVSEYSVEDGQQVELQCTADGNPSKISYEWKHLGTGNRYAQSTWNLTATRETAGEYKCEATNSVGKGANAIGLQVQFGPKVLLPETVKTPAEGDTVTIDCDYKSEPSADSVEWTGPNGFASRGVRLSIPSITREQSGNYTCSVTNYLTVYGMAGSQPRTGKGVVLIDVLRAPGRAEITSENLSIAVGDSIVLDCRATDVGSPAAAYKWASPSTGGQFGSRDHTKSRLVIPNAQLSDNGEYRCIPYNDIGNGEEAVVSITVIERASISRPMAKERIFDAGEGFANLSCEASGYPAPIVHWVKDGQIVNFDGWETETTQVHSSCPPTQACTQTVMSVLKWTRAVEWSDKGNYSCVASNGAAGGSDQSWSLVRVVHGPVVLNDLYPKDGLAAADLGSTATIACRVSARPPPVFEWLRNSEPITEGDRYSIIVNQERERPDESESVLYISKVTESDYGSYICRSKNGKGEKAEIAIRLKQRSVPQRGEKIIVFEQTATSLYLGWKPGFDGGYPQTYEVEYRMLDPNTESIGEVEKIVKVENASRARFLMPTEKTRHRRAASSPSYVDVVAYNLTGLKPLSTYYVRTRGVNALGKSDFNQIVIAYTEDVKTSPEIPAPKSIRYDSATDSILSDPPLPADACLLVYISPGEVWRSLDCNRTISGIPGAVRLRARFCTGQGEGATCSALSPVLEVGMMSPPYRLTFMLPIGALIVICVVIFAFLLICCKIRNVPKKKDKKKKHLADERPEVSGPMPAPDAKNTTVHGSAADSGVFTLDSNNLPQKGSKAYANGNYSSNETGVDVWPPANDGYEFNADPYINEYPTGQTFYDGVVNQPNNECATTATTSYDDGDESDEAYASGGRGTGGGGRVLREIIV